MVKAEYKVGSASLSAGIHRIRALHHIQNAYKSAELIILAKFDGERYELSKFL